MSASVAFDLAAARLNAGHSVKSLARELGLHEHTLRRLEHHQPVHPANAKKVADWAGCRVTDIMPVEVEQ